APAARASRAEPGLQRGSPHDAPAELPRAAAPAPVVPACRAVTAGGSSIPEVQRLLAVLATGRRCAETGTAYGEGAAAIASTAASLVTVESDPERAKVAAGRLAEFANVELLVGDWRGLLPPRAPYDLIFFD